MSGYGGDQYGEGGGGFTASQAGGYDRNGGGAKKPFDPVVITPLTGRQVALADCRDSKVRIDGQDVYMISLVGQLHSVEAASTFISFVCDDGTGDVKVKMNIHEGRTFLDGIQNVVQFAYVRIHGKVTEGNGYRGVTATHVARVVDYNELSFHALDALRWHLNATQGPVAAANNAYPVKQQYSNQPINQPIHQSTYQSTNDRDRVMSAFAAATGELGASVLVVSEQCKLSIQRIREIVRELSDEGMIYVTQDEDHYKAVEQ